MATNKRISRSRVNAAIVEYGVRLSITNGREAASKFFSRVGVPLHVARRVLLPPNRRRKTVELETAKNPGLSAKMCDSAE